MKKFLSLVLSLALAMGLATTALAASAEGVEFTTPDGYTYKISSVLKTLGDSAYQVPVGTTITVESQNSYNEFYGPVAKFIAAELKENGFGEPYFEADDANSAKNYNISGEPGKAFTFTADKPGLWRVSLMDEVLFYFLPAGISLEVVGDTAEPVPEEPEAPTEPTTPVEPEVPTEPTAPVEPETPVVPDAPGTYTVKKGDTMGQISVNYYGSYAYHKALYQANSAAFAKTNGKLLPGMVLTLPETLGKATLKAAPAAAEGETLYTVKAGDTLGAIAKAAYGDVMQYKAIFQRNADRLVNANTIYEGQVIVLPAK